MAADFEADARGAPLISDWSLGIHYLRLQFGGTLDKIPRHHAVDG